MYRKIFYLLKVYLYISFFNIVYFENKQKVKKCADFDKRRIAVEPPQRILDLSSILIRFDAKEKDKKTIVFAKRDLKLCRLLAAVKTELRNF